MSHESGGRGSAQDNREGGHSRGSSHGLSQTDLEERQVRFASRGENQNNDPTDRFYSQVAEIQRSWHDAQYTIAGLRGREEITMTRNRELTDENKPLREQIARDSLSEDRKRRRGNDAQGCSQGTSSIAQSVQKYRCRMSILVNESDVFHQFIKDLSLSHGPTIGDEGAERSLLYFARFGDLGKWYCLREISETGNYFVNKMSSLSSDCAAHGRGRLQSHWVLTPASSLPIFLSAPTHNSAFSARQHHKDQQTPHSKSTMSWEAGRLRGHVDHYRHQGATLEPGRKATSLEAGDATEKEATRNPGRLSKAARRRLRRRNASASSVFASAPASTPNITPGGPSSSAPDLIASQLILDDNVNTEVMEHLRKVFAELKDELIAMSFFSN
ncbi:hypothetical protein FSARC_11222 [Fusarium sarcochroum]|uniref:Uncharacterized protein n=1 Tax=Fusarium sarcochroum TaxID=1208366 RepID=A0A8H4TGU4_9HYPO|nr:hypothetical protein FSARC_11222 [Fusarium sarcochroum]